MTLPDVRFCFFSESDLFLYTLALFEVEINDIWKQNLTEGRSCYFYATTVIVRHSFLVVQVTDCVFQGS